MIQNAYVGLGSNLGDRAGYLLLAVRGMLDAGLDVIRLTSIYETEPVEYEKQPVFLNMVAELRGSTLPSPELVPSLVHPVLRKPISELLTQTKDRSTVRRWAAG